MFRFWIFAIFVFLIFVVFFGGAAFCLFVVLCFWYTFAISTVFLRVPKTESDFRCTDYWYCYQDLYYY